VGIADAAGSLHLTRVIRNVYASSEAEGVVATAIVALDRREREVFRLRLVAE